MTVVERAENPDHEMARLALFRSWPVAPRSPEATRYGTVGFHPSFLFVEPAIDMARNARFIPSRSNERALTSPLMNHGEGMVSAFDLRLLPTWTLDGRNRSKILQGRQTPPSGRTATARNTVRSMYNTQMLGDHKWVPPTWPIVHRGSRTFTIRPVPSLLEDITELWWPPGPSLRQSLGFFRPDRLGSSIDTEKPAHALQVRPFSHCSYGTDSLY